MARLVPLATTGLSLDDLIATGAVRPPRRRDRPTPEPLDVPVDARTDRALREVR
jgi:hypothetical protein